MAHLGAILLGLVFSTLCSAKSFSAEFPTELELDFVYHKYADVSRYLHRVAGAYPELTRIRPIGKSIDGRDLLTLRISATPDDKLGVPNIKFVGEVHGNEVPSGEVILHLIQYLVTNYSTNSTVQWLLNNTRIHMLPMMNPDGVENAVSTDCEKFNVNGRKNRHGIDLNRDFPDYFRKNTRPIKPEASAMMEWLKEVPFVLSGSLHTGALVVNYPFDNTYQDSDSSVTGVPPSASLTPDDDVFKHIASVYSFTHPTMHRGLPCPGLNTLAFENGTTNGAVWYTVTGGMQDYNYAWHGCLELTIEVSCCTYPPKEHLPQLWAENKEALLRFAAQVHHGVKGLVLDYETNKTIPEARLWIDDRMMGFNASSKGEFWRILLPGNYTLKVSASNYRNESFPFEVTRSAEDFESQMTWLNVSLISENSNVSRTETSTTSTSTSTSTATPTTSTSTVPPSSSPPPETLNYTPANIQQLPRGSAVKSTAHWSLRVWISILLLKLNSVILSSSL